MERTVLILGFAILVIAEARIDSGEEYVIDLRDSRELYGGNHNPYRHNSHVKNYIPNYQNYDKNYNLWVPVYGHDNPYGIFSEFDGDNGELRSPTKRALSALSRLKPLGDLRRNSAQNSNGNIKKYKPDGRPYGQPIRWGKKR